ncbi:hypothetical protein ACHAPU_003217 [Fusarium lateritium]
MGTLQEILDRAEACQVCRLVIDVHKERYKRLPNGFSKARSEFGDAIEIHDEVEKHGLRLTFQNEPIKCYLKNKHFSLTRTSLVAEAGPGTVGANRVRLELDPCPWRELLVPSLSLQAIWPHGILNSKKRSSKGGFLSLEGTGRAISSVADLSIPRHWIRQCEENHGDKCSNPRWLGDNGKEWPRDSLVIDVEEGRIVNLLPNMRYVALSYVWGSSEKAKRLRSEKQLTRDNTHRLRGFKGLEEMPIPQTIKDAMVVVRDVGERFLWVDALCIVQDDPEDVGQQTGRMDLIYSKALFTILAACGEDSESGLVGLSSNPRDTFQRQVKVAPSGLHIVPCVTLSDDDTLQFSAWNTRGWTFQERLLSRRVLIFTNSQMYWCCDDTTWDEESTLDTPESKAHALAHSFGCHDEWEDMETKFSEDGYRTYVTQFSERQFTFPSDALPAFMGIIRRYEHLHGQKLHWGLSTVRFDQKLAWRGGENRRKELYTYISDDSVVRSVPYPSWSWLGWTGFISSNLTHRFKKSQDEMDSGCSILTFYSLMSDGSVSLIDGSASLSKEPASGRHDDDTSREDSSNSPCVEVPGSVRVNWMGDTKVSGSIRLDDVLLASELQALGINGNKKCQPSPAPYETGRIVFWTSHTEVMVYVDTSYRPHIEVQGKPVKLEVDLAMEAMESRRYFPGMTEGDDHTGTGSKERSTNEMNDLIPRYPISLIVISRWFGYHAKGEETRKKMNLICVEERVPGSGVWSRIGFGVIAEEEWTKLNLDWKLVVLE